MIDNLRMDNVWRRFRRDLIFVNCRFDDFESCIRKYRKQWAGSGIGKTLKTRNNNPSLGSRKREKARIAESRRRRLARKQGKYKR